MLPLLLAGCGAERAPSREEGTPDVDPTAVACSGDAAERLGASPLRRLTQKQYDNTVRDLLGIEATTASGFPSDERSGPFPSNSISAVSPAHLRRYQDGADALALVATASDRLPGLVGCDPATTGDGACAAEFIQTFATRAFRVPADEAVTAGLQRVYDAGAAQGGFANGIRLVVSAALQAPQFLYRVETKAPPGAEKVRVSSYEIASRLSYFLWNTMPDAELFAAAEGDTLQDVGVLTEHATRMLSDDRARDAVATFAESWLGISGVRHAGRDRSDYIWFLDGTGQAMINETLSFFDWVVRDGDGRLDTLLTAPYTIIADDRLFPIYGIARPQDHDPLGLVALPPGERAGILTQPAFLTAHSHPDQTSPVKRGVYVLNNVLCNTFSPPTDIVVGDVPEPNPDLTTRQRFMIHEEAPQCAKCHVDIDGVGFNFEVYDPIGAYRLTEGKNELPVDSSGGITLGADTRIPTRDAVDLVHEIARSDDLRTCATKQLYRFAFGRMEGIKDACVLDTLGSRFKESGGNMRQLMLDIATSDAFRSRASEE